MERLYFMFLRMMVVAGLRMSFATLKMSGNLTLRAHQFLPFLEGGKAAYYFFSCSVYMYKYIS